MNIYIKYNPYKIQTKVIIDGEEVERDSFLNIEDGKRLEEWIEEFPSEFERYYQSCEANIEFHGTLLDFGDFNEVIENANSEGFKFELKYRKLKKDFKDIEKNPDKIYQEIQKSEFEELKSEQKNNVYIKYNPYKIQTKVIIDGEEVEKNSFLNIEDGKRLQEWIEKFPSEFEEESQSREANIEFHGTLLDFEDFKEVIENANSEGFKFELKHIKPEKDFKDIEKNLDKIYQKIQKSEFEELKSEQLKNAYDNAKKSEFEVSVIATMSSGKSTVINSLLGKKLMPAKNEACTAIITRIKDNNEPEFIGEVFDKKGNKKSTYLNVTLKDMEKINEDEDVSEVRLEGEIPFLFANETALVLVDTPGPNNSMTNDHKETTYRMIHSSSKTLVMYILNGTQLATNDDKKFLFDVAESMKINGKQNKDRFIFIVNKVDTFNKGEDSVPGTIEKAKKYLKGFGIENPKIFPASAKMALDIRNILDVGAENVDEDILDEVKMNVKKFNRNDEKYLEKYSKTFFPKSINRKIDNLLENESAYGQALIHSGIISIEEYIKMYTEKYAKTAKIKNVLDSFYTALENMKEEEEIKKEISESEEKREEFKIILEKLERTINDNTFKKDLDKAIEEINFSKKLTIEARGSERNTSMRITKELEDLPRKMDPYEAENRLKRLKRFTEDEMEKLKINFEEMVKETVRKTEVQLINIYEKQLKKLDKEINEDTELINLNTFNLISSQVNLNTSSIIDSCTKTEEKIVGYRKERIENSERKGWGIFKFWKPKYIETEVPKIETEEYVDGKTLSITLITEIEDNLRDSVDEYIKEIEKLEKNIIQSFKDRKKEIINILNEKAEELEQYIREDAKQEHIIEKNKRRLSQLESLIKEVNELVEF